MNYWSLRTKSEITLQQRLQKLIFKHVDVQPAQRGKYSLVIVFGNYMISYVVIFALIMQSLAREFMNKIERDKILSGQRLPQKQMQNILYQEILVVFLVRIGSALLYIGFQKVQILLVSKLLLVTNIFLTQNQSSSEEFIGIEIVLLLLQLLALAVWAYKIQTRVVHFDSRLDMMKPFLKEGLVFVACFMMRRLQKSAFSEIFVGEFIQTTSFSVFQIQAVQLLCVTLLLITFIDFLDMIYKKDFKRLLLGLDISYSALLTSWIFCIKFTGKNEIYTNSFMLLASLIGMQLVIVFQKDNFRILYQIQGNKLQYLSQSKLIEYFEALRRLVNEDGISQTQRNVEIIKYIEFHKRTCLYPACPFTKRFNVQDSVFLKSQLIQQYIVKILEQLSKTRPKIRAYLIFYLSPNDKVFRYLNGQHSYIRRQIWRINQVKREMSNEIRILQAEIVLKKTTQLIQEYLACGKRYFDTLMKQHVNGENVVAYGGRMLELIAEIQKMKQNSINFTQSVRILLNNFSSRLIHNSKTPILQTVVDPPFLINRTTQVGPTLIVSAQPQNFLKIIDANTACTKQFYYPKQVFLSVTAIDLLPQQIKVQHKEHFDRVSKKTDFDGKKDFPTSIFVVNKNGYMAFFTAVVYLLNSIKGRMWCVTLQMTHKIDAIMLIAMEKNGVVMGISEMAVFHGLKTTDKDKELTEDFYKRLKTKQAGSKQYTTVTVKSDQKIFMNDNFSFGSDKELFIVEEFSAFGLTYYLVDIKSVNEFNYTKSYNQMLNSRKQIEQGTGKNNNTHGILEMNHVPKHQYFYHSDGKVRKLPQSQQSLNITFAVQIQKNSTTVVQIKGQLNEGISQMLLAADKLDYLENIDREKQFMVRPMTKVEKRDQELQNFNLSLNFFQQSLQTHQQTTPKWLKRTRLFFIFMGLILSSILIAQLIENTNKIHKNLDYTTSLKGIQNILSNYIELSVLMLSAKYYDPIVREKLKSLIVEKNQQIESSSVQIFSMDSTIEKYLNRPDTVKSISSYIIAISNLTEISDKGLSSFDEQPVLSNLALKIVPLFNSLINQKLSYLDSLLSPLLSLGMFLGYSLILVGILVWVYFTTQIILTLKNNTLKIMIKLSDTFLQKELTKLLLFEEYLYYGKEIYEQDDLDYIMNQKKNQEIQQEKARQITATIGSKGILRSSKKKITQWRNVKQQNQRSYKRFPNIKKGGQDDIISSQKQTNADSHNNQQSLKSQKDQQEEQVRIYVKKLVNPQKVNRVRIFTLVWVLLVGAFSFLMYRSSDDYSTLSQRITKINYNLRKMHASADNLWAMLNIFPYNVNVLDYSYADFFVAEDEYRKEVTRMIFEKRFSRDFVSFYQDIWMENSCKYLQRKLPECLNVIGGSLAEGASQLVSFMARKFNYLMSINMSSSQFHSSKISKDLSTIDLSYLTQVILINVQMVEKQQEKIDKIYQREQFIYFTAVLIVSSMIIVVYKLLSRQNQNLIKIQQLFKLIEFDSLKNNKQLKFYFKKNYYDKIYK